MLKIVDEVRYDLFRRVLAARCSADSNSTIKDAEAVTKVAVERLKALGIVKEED